MTRTGTALDYKFRVPVGFTLTISNPVIRFFFCLESGTSFFASSQLGYYHGYSWSTLSLQRTFYVLDHDSIDSTTSANVKLPYAHHYQLMLSRLLWRDSI
jgi:hypothetical protein